MLTRYLYLAGGISLIGALVFAYYKGYVNASEHYRSMMDTAYAENLKSIQEILVSQDTREKEIVSSYLSQIETLKEAQYEEIQSIKSEHISDTVKCMSDSNTSKGVSPKVRTRSDLICYTEAELLRKIKESMVIAGECDQLAARYNTLLKVCK